MFEDVQLSVICHGSKLEASGVSYLGEQMGEKWRMRTGNTAPSEENPERNLHHKHKTTGYFFLQDFIQTNDI